MSHRIGVDVGGTSIRLRRFPGAEDDRIDVATEARGGEAIADRIAGLVTHLNAGRPTPELVGIGIPGQVDPDEGTVRHAINLGIDGTPFPLASYITERLGIEVAIENDVRTAALGAYHQLGLDQPRLSDLIYLSLGTGISAGVIIGGRLHRGSHGIAGEIGHAPLGDQSTPCRCGLVGCLEAVAGGRSLDDRVLHGARRLFDEPSSNPAARTKVAAAVARALYVLATAYDPDIFVLGGGIGPDAASEVRKALDALSGMSPLGDVVLTGDRVMTLPSDADVGTTGAALLTSGSAPADTQPGRTRP